jgi:hypothetical protein
MYFYNDFEIKAASGNLDARPGGHGASKTFPDLT